MISKIIARNEEISLESKGFGSWIEKDSSFLGENARRTESGGGRKL